LTVPQDLTQTRATKYNNQTFQQEGLMPPRTDLPPTTSSQVKQLPPPQFTLPHIEATFEGGYFKGVPGAMEVVPFSCTVKIPNSWLSKDEHYPANVFKNQFADRVMKNKPEYPGFSGVRTCLLTRTTELPSGLTQEQELNWTADYSRMAELAKRVGKMRFVPLDPKEGTPLPAESVEIKPEFYPDLASLRNAIKRCVAEPQAFKAEQDKLSSGYERKRDELSMQDELKALGY